MLLNVSVFKARNGKIAVVLGAPKSEADACALADMGIKIHLSQSAYAKSDSGWVKLR